MADEPFNQAQENRLQAVVDGEVSKQIAYWRRILAIVAVIVTPVLGFLGWLGADQLRDQWNREQDRIIATTVTERSKTIEENLKADLATSAQKNELELQVLNTQFEDDRKRLYDRMDDVVNAASAKDYQTRIQLDNFVEQQKAIIAQKAQEIQNEITNAVAIRMDLDEAKQSAAKSEGDLKLQLAQEEAASNTVLALLNQMSVQCAALEKEKKDLDDQIASVQPKMEAIRGIILDKHAAEIFAKIQQEFTRIRSLEIRVTYSFPGTTARPVVPFSGLWIRRDGRHFLQLYPETDKTTSIRGKDTVDMVYRYVLFAPFEMATEGRPIQILKNVDKVEIYFVSSPEMYARDDGKNPEPDYVMFISAFQQSLKELTSVRVQVLLNGYSSFEKRFSAANLAIPTLPPNGLGQEWTRSILLPVSDLFQDPENDYTRQFAPSSL